MSCETKIYKGATLVKRIEAKNADDTMVTLDDAEDIIAVARVGNNVLKVWRKSPAGGGEIALERELSTAYLINIPTELTSGLNGKQLTIDVEIRINGKVIPGSFGPGEVFKYVATNDL